MKLPSRMIDLSSPLENETVYDPPFMRPKIEYKSNADTAALVCELFPGLRREDLPDGEGWAIENIQLTTHNGTHMDAPIHFQSKSIDGKPMMTIDQVPLDWFFRPGVKLDFRKVPDGHVVTAAEVEAELKHIGHALKPFDIVLVNTRASECIGSDEYLTAGCGMGREATLYLTSRGVRVTGIDAWAGTRLSCIPASAGLRRTTPRSSGRATKPAARFPIAIWRSCKTSNSFPLTVSPSPASRTRSKPAPRAGPARWRCLIKGIPPRDSGAGGPRSCAVGGPRRLFCTDDEAPSQRPPPPSFARCASYGWSPSPASWGRIQYDPVLARAPRPRVMSNSDVETARIL